MKHSRNQQIEAVLKGSFSELLEECYGNPPYTPSAIREVVDFSWDEALDSVTNGGFPSGSYTRGDSGADGIHLESKDGLWVMYFQEKNTESLRFESSDANEVRESLMGLMIYLSGLIGPINFTKNFELSVVKKAFLRE